MKKEDPRIIICISCGSLLKISLPPANGKYTSKKIKEIIILHREEKEQIEKPSYCIYIYVYCEQVYNKRGIKKHPQVVIILEFILSRINLINRIEIYILCNTIFMEVQLKL